MSDLQFGKNYNEAVGAGVEAGIGGPGTPTPKDGLPGAIGTSMDSTVAGYDIERTIQGNQLLESLESGQKDVRIGGTGPFVGVNGVGLESIPYSTTTIIPTSVSGTGSFTGTHYSGSGTLPAFALSYGPVLSITTVTSGVTTFPVASTATSGAGYSLSGNNLLFTNGTAFPTWSGAAVALLIPKSGQTFTVNYIYGLANTIIYSGAGTAPITMLDNDRVNLAYIPNVGNRFSR
jgi:hypothetical protein